MYKKDYDFYKDYYWKNNLTKVIEDSLLQYKQLLNAQDFVIYNLTHNVKENADVEQKPKMFNTWYEKVENKK